MGAYGLFFLVAVAIGGVAWVFLYPHLSGEKKAERRMASSARAEPIARPTRAAGKTRREQVEGTLKDIEERQKKASRPPLSVRLRQAGL
ncbi:MAG: pilus assembly protein, partial [Xanthobacteraceae bacterium]